MTASGVFLVLQLPNERLEQTSRTRDFIAENEQDPSRLSAICRLHQEISASRSSELRGLLLTSPPVDASLQVTTSPHDPRVSFCDKSSLDKCRPTVGITARLAS
jgi:hypothetical protein